MLEVLENVDSLMSRIDGKNYSRLLANLSSIIYLQSLQENPYAIWAIAELKAQINNDALSEEEKAILMFFAENPKIRPAVLAAVYSRVIRVNFKIHYSV